MKKKSKRRRCEENEKPTESELADTLIISQEETHTTLKLPIECFGVAEYNYKGEDGSFYTVLEDQNAVFAGVMDGHLSTTIPKWLSSEIPLRIKNISSAENPLSVDTKHKLSSFFKTLDEDALESQGEAKEGGSCVISCLITASKITIANLGDCGALLVKKSGDHKWLSNFLNAKDTSEKNRIRSEHPEESNYQLFSDGWIKGYLQPTRTIGDFYLKKEEFKKKPYGDLSTYFRGPYISNIPEFQEFERDGSEQFLVIASDGLWDFCSDDAVAELITKLHTKKDLKGKNIGEFLASAIKILARENMCYKQDDCTVMVIEL